MSFRLGGVLIFATAALWLWVNPAPAETLEEAWATALAVDQRLRASRLQTESARWDCRAARSLYAPKVANMTGYTLLSDTPRFRIDLPQQFTLESPFAEEQSVVSSTMLTIPIYTGGQIRHAVNAAASQISAAEQEETRTALDIKLEVAAAYVSILRARRAVEVTQANVASLESHERIVQNMLDQGLVAKNDLLAAQVAMADARQRTIQALNAVEVTQAAYNGLLRRPLTEAVAIEEPEVPSTEDDLETLTGRAIALRPEIARLAAQINALRSEASSVRAGTRPHLGVTGGFTYLENNHIAPEGYGSLTFGMAWTPYDGGTARFRSNALLQKANALARLRAHTVTAFTLEVHKAYLDEQETRKRIEVTSRAIDQAEENLRIARNRFKQGHGTNADVLDAETLRARSYNNYYNAVYDAVLATLRLRRAVGTL